MTQIFFSTYSLQKKRKLNSQDSLNTQYGALVKIVEGLDWGVADICPKTELGDLDLTSEIKNRGVLFTRALELAQEDLQARKAYISLLADQKVKNNFLITDYRAQNLNGAQYHKKTIKIKANRDIFVLSGILNRIDVDVDVRIRLDFNSILDVEDYEHFLNSLSTSAKNKIEYIEDPVSCESERVQKKWKDWNKLIPLAFDFQKIDYNLDIAQYRIVKPGRQKLNPELKYFTLTSAMEHPVGLAHGLRIAQAFARNVSGFLILDLFEENNFNKYFEQSDDNLNFSKLARDDFGIGMTEELNKLKWVRW